MGENMTNLTKITTPFGLLEEETQEALKAHGGPWEYYDGHSWSTRIEPLFARSCVYRVKPQPMTKPSIDWLHVAPQYKWLARDRNGSTWLFIEKPKITSKLWVAGGPCRNADCFASYTPGTCDWRNSLVEMPE